MIEKVEEPIEILTQFHDGHLRPLRFRWRGRVHTVSEVTGSWVHQVGEHRVHYFSVLTGTTDSYEICYRVRTCRWVLESISRTGSHRR